MRAMFFAGVAETVKVQTQIAIADHAEGLSEGFENGDFASKEAPKQYASIMPWGKQKSECGLDSAWPKNRFPNLRGIYKSLLGIQRPLTDAQWKDTECEWKKLLDVRNKVNSYELNEMKKTNESCNTTKKETLPVQWKLVFQRKFDAMFALRMANLGRCKEWCETMKKLNLTYIDKDGSVRSVSDEYCNFVLENYDRNDLYENKFFLPGDFQKYTSLKSQPKSFDFKESQFACLPFPTAGSRKFTCTDENPVWQAAQLSLGSNADMTLEGEFPTLPEQCLRKPSHESIKEMVPQRLAVKAFVGGAIEYFKKENICGDEGGVQYTSWTTSWKVQCSEDPDPIRTTRVKNICEEGRAIWPDWPEYSQIGLVEERDPGTGELIQVKVEIDVHSKYPATKGEQFQAYLHAGCIALKKECDKIKQSVQTVGSNGDVTPQIVNEFCNEMLADGFKALGFHLGWPTYKQHDTVKYPPKCILDETIPLEDKEPFGTKEEPKSFWERGVVKERWGNSGLLAQYSGSVANLRDARLDEEKQMVEKDKQRSQESRDILAINRAKKNVDTQKRIVEEAKKDLNEAKEKLKKAERNLHLLEVVQGANRAARLAEKHPEQTSQGAKTR